MPQAKANSKAGYSVRVWLSNDDLERFKNLSEKTDLAQTEIMTKMLHAGMQAVVDDGFRLNLPVEFEVRKEIYGLNEPRSIKPTTTRK